jgi:hypothetical protein
MRIQGVLSVAGVLAAASLTLGCHAHGDQAVSAVDHGVKVEFFRHATQDATVELRITNGASQPVCLSLAAFEPSSFTVKTDQGMVQSASPAAPAAPGCDLLAPGAVKALSVNAGLGFSRLELQTGRMCYHYAFGTPAGPAAWQATGLVCE